MIWKNKILIKGIYPYLNLYIIISIILILNLKDIHLKIYIDYEKLLILKRIFYIFTNNNGKIKKKIIEKYIISKISGFCN